jgi:type II secretory pathway component PulF
MTMSESFPFAGQAVRAAGATADGRKRNLSASDLALGLRVLADALEAGLPMHRALTVFAEIAPPTWAHAIPTMCETIRQGRSLAAALEEAPLRIPPLVVGMTRAGEAGSGVGPAIRRAADHAQSAADTGEAVRSALAYPFVVAAAGVGSIAVMIGVVIPRFATVLTDLGQDLPPMTHAVLGFAGLARMTVLPLGTLLLLGLVSVAAWRRTDAGALALDRFWLRLPLVGPVRFSAATARLCAALSALLHSGVPIRSALSAAARASGDAEVAFRVKLAQSALIAGHTLSGALSDAAAVTPTAARLIRAGEESGRMAPLLEHAARIERHRAERTIARSVRLLEPSLILAFAGVVGVVAMALLQAVYAVRPV